MSTEHSIPISQIRQDIRLCMKECMDRGLQNTSKFLGEQLVGLKKQHTSTSYKFTYPQEECVDEQDSILFDHYTFSKSLFDLKEYLRCADTLDAPLQSHGRASTTYKKALFLRYYALYLAGERRKEQERAEASTNLSNNAHSHQTQNVCSKQIVNPQIRSLLSDLNQMTNKDAYLTYLNGVVQNKMGDKKAALDSFIQSVYLQPLLWCSWLEIVSLMTHLLHDNASSDQELYDDQQHKFTFQQMIDKIFSRVKPHWMNELFLSHVHIEMLSSQGGVSSPGSNGNHITIKILKDLQEQILPRSSYITSQLAMAHNHMQDYQQAQTLFEQLRIEEPYRIEHMDTFSNILYIKESKPQLSLLAHEFQRIDKYRAETCCIIGNYYSSRSEHEKAVLYFQRALKIDPSYLSAWTLMGHEYIEMKNTTAAVNAYRTAVDIHPRDYRAWYGLGQTYEILNMPHYALYYYSKACTLRPYDGRMWCALAGCYEQLEQYHDALRCYQKARENEGKTLALVKMADLHKKIGQNAQAVALYLKCLDEHKNLLRLEQDQGHTGSNELLSEDVEAGALLFIARYYQKEAQPPCYPEAKKFCTELVTRFSGQYKASAAQMLKEMSGVGLSTNLFGSSTIRSPSDAAMGGSMSFMM